MSREKPERAELLRALDEELRNIGAGSVLFSQAVADHLGMNSSDLECLDILSRAGPVTAGRLAELTGLTTGAITGLVDRLERAGYVQREPDPTDRRRVFIRPLPLSEEQSRQMEPLFGSLARAMGRLSERYSDDDLALIVDFMRNANELVRHETARLRGEPAAEEASGDFAAPLGVITGGRLVFLAGAANLAIKDDPAAEYLYRAHFTPPLPAIEVETSESGRSITGTISVRYSRRPSWPRLRRRGRSTAEIGLNRSIPWQIEVRGGAVHMTTDLDRLQLARLEVGGGASHVNVMLPAPSGTVPVRIAGGAVHVTLLRPSGVPIRALIEGGASQITLDEQHFGAVGGRTRWQSPDFERSSDRYEIEVQGGSHDFTIASR